MRAKHRCHEFDRPGHPAGGGAAGLGLEGESFFEVAVDEGVIVLRPVAIVPRDQARPSASEGARP